MRDKLIKIKRSRLKPEELFLIDILNEIKIIHQNDYFIFWGISDEILFVENLEFGWLSCSREKIWDVIDDTYGENYEYGVGTKYNKIRGLIRETSKLYKDWEELTPIHSEELEIKKIYKYAKNKDNK